MRPTDSNIEKVKVFFQIFLPILVYQMANFSASFVDTMMTGQYGTLDLAGVAMATSIWHPLFTLVTGTISALVPIIGHHLGQGQREGCEGCLAVYLSVFDLSDPFLNHHWFWCSAFIRGALVWFRLVVSELRLVPAGPGWFERSVRLEPPIQPGYRCLQVRVRDCEVGVFFSKKQNKVRLLIRRGLRRFVYQGGQHWLQK